ncbi:DUF6119 family protein [Amycolatopsis sp. NPDC058340]|uniref:DUF6119 family protein n=1 Tax=Amycolatopsis sp. NPDC058340 TaxID=3346453 RepID=UPI00364BA08B
MPRQPSKSAKTSLYRLRLPANDQLETAVQDKYLKEKGFTAIRTTVDKSDALLVYGTILNDSPTWIRHAASVSSIPFQLTNQTSAGLLLVRIESTHDYCYGLSWSMGHLVINPTCIDDGFGLKFALRRAHPESVSALTSHALDTVPRTARTTVFGGASLPSFGLEEIGEIVSRFVGKIETDGLTCDVRPTGGKPRSKAVRQAARKITVRGADSLGIPLAKLPGGLLSDLKQIDSVIETEEAKPELAHLEDTQPLKPGNGKIPMLEAALSADLKEDTASMSLCWPAEFDSEPGEITQYKVFGSGSTKPPLYEELDLHCLTAPLAHLEPNARLSRLRTMRIQGQSEEGTALTREISGDKWILYQTKLNGESYVFHRGRWYNIGGAYLTMLNSRLDRIFSNKSNLNLPEWPKQKKIRKSDSSEYLGWANERHYNDHVVGIIKGHVSLDRQLIYTEQHPHGFEACDILTPDGRLVHVKRLDDSIAASHLFNQASNSAEALVRQPDALEKFREKVSVVSGGQHTLSDDFEPKVVVIAFAGKGRSPGDLFTFSQVSLVRCEQRIATLGLKLEIAFIEESNDVLEIP